MKLRAGVIIRPRMFAAPAAIFLLVIAATLFVSSCGSQATTVTATVSTGQAGETAAAAASTAATSPASAGSGGPIMPNVDETQVAGVEAAAAAAFEHDWGDGSGVHVVWGPNIISGWALIGVENESGAAGKDVLLHQEGGSWQVKDVGHALAAKWEGQTPAELWPSM